MRSEIGHFLHFFSIHLSSFFVLIFYGLQLDIIDQSSRPYKEVAISYLSLFFVFLISYWMVEEKKIEGPMSEYDDGAKKNLIRVLFEKQIAEQEWAAKIAFFGASTAFLFQCMVFFLGRNENRITEYFYWVLFLGFLGFGMRPVLESFDWIEKWEKE
ncbi:MAG: hypothetical protein L3J04_00065 [Robiginitomaculum sp.]|nr:hypothetical protein [Robiginitomaculum sp.]